MTWPILSIVKVHFSGQEIKEGDLQEIETLLRRQETVDHLAVHPQQMSFYIWSREKADYSVLDELKNKLSSLGYSGFKLCVQEYRLAGNGTCEEDRQEKAVPAAF